MYSVKSSTAMGCTFLGKGIKHRPEMGVVMECREVVMDEKDIFGEWAGEELIVVMFRTDNGYVFDGRQLQDGSIVIENYAPNWRAKAGYPWKVVS